METIEVSRHGTLSTYQRERCRCEECSRANREYWANKPPCAYCEETSKARGMCAMHLNRWYRSGKPSLDLWRGGSK